MTKITRLPVLEVEIDIDFEGFKGAFSADDARAVRLQEEWHYLDFMVVERAEQKAEERGLDAYCSHNTRKVYVRLCGGTVEQYKDYLSNLTDVLEEADAWVTIRPLEDQSMTQTLTMDWGDLDHVDADGCPIEPPPRGCLPRTYSEGPSPDDDRHAAESDRLANLAGEK